MTTKYKKSSEVPTAVLANRLEELADAVTKGCDAVDREFTMRIPAECDRDADLVLSEAARRLSGDTIPMPRELTAENGAKHLMMGEFSEVFSDECDSCGGSEYNEQGDKCSECFGIGSIEMIVPVSWTTIKAIYARAVEHFAGGDR